MRTLKIAGIERIPDLEKNSLDIQKALTYQIDTCSFSLKGVQPTEGEEVIIEDRDRKFAGIITKVELSRTFPDRSIKIWNIDCDDYTYLIDRRLVVETYQSTAENPIYADEIFRDIAAKYCPGFTVSGVRSGAPMVEYMVFDYVPPSECFKKLCDYIGWHWQPDYYKDLQFFSAEELATPAPITLVPGGNFRFGKHSINTQGLRNRVYVRGGTMLSDPVTYEYVADGAQRAWILPYKPHGVAISVAGSDPVTPGIENIDEESAKPWMMNFEEKMVRLSSGQADIAQGTTVAFTFKFDIDVITMVEDEDSQAAIALVQGGDGVYEYVLVDDTLTTIEAAEAAGMADLRDHANPAIKGNFETEQNGWAPGQLVDIALPDRGVDGTFLIQKVTISAPTPEIWTHKIEYGGRLKGTADFLKALVSTQQNKQLGETTILSKFWRANESASASDVFEILTGAPLVYCGTGGMCGFVQCSG